MSTDVETAEAAQAEAPKTPAKASVYEASKEIAIRRDGGAAVPMPATFAQMQDFAATMSRAGPMVGKPFRDNPGACLAILTQSMRWAMDPYAVSQKAYVASQNGDGPIGYEGQLVAAVVQSIAPLQKRLRCEYSGEGDDRRITVIGMLKGEDEPFTYTSPPLAKLRPAKKDSGYLKGSQLWETDPDQQLWYYGVRAWSRKWTPDVILGVYTPDEIGEIQRGDRTIDGGEAITLMGAPAQARETAQDAEYTPVDVLLNKGGKENADPKAGAEAGDGGVSGKPDTPKGKGKAPRGGSKAAAAAAAAPEDDGSHTQRAGGEAELSGEPGSAHADTGTGADDADSATDVDEQLLQSIESKLDPNKALSSRRAVSEARGALALIAEHGTEVHKARARKILAAWPAQ